MVQATRDPRLAGAPPAGPARESRGLEFAKRVARQRPRLLTPHNPELNITARATVAKAGVPPLGGFALARGATFQLCSNMEGTVPCSACKRML